MKKLLYLSLSFFPALFASESDQFTSKLPNIRSYYAVNRYLNNNQKNIPFYVNALRNILTIEDVFDGIIYAAVNKGMSKMVDRTMPSSNKSTVTMKSLFIEGLLLNKSSQLINYVFEKRISANVSKKIEFLSPIISKKDLQDCLNAGSYAAIEQIMKDRKFVAPHIKREVLKSIAKKFIRNKIGSGVKAINTKFNIIDQNNAFYAPTATLGYATLFLTLETIDFVLSDDFAKTFITTSGANLVKNEMILRILIENYYMNKKKSN